MLSRQKDIAVVTAVSLVGLLCLFVLHCVWVTSNVYSNPSIVLSSGVGSKDPDYLYDDFREAYYWLRMNTPEDAKVMAWWDYGYQITSMANRTILVDNNTWNNTHIATVGRAFAASEEAALPLLRSLDVDYVLVRNFVFVSFSVLFVAIIVEMVSSFYIYVLLLLLLVVKVVVVKVQVFCICLPLLF